MGSRWSYSLVAVVVDEAEEEVVGWALLGMALVVVSVPMVVRR